MSNKKYFPTNMEKQKALTSERLKTFLKDPKAKIMFMSEPVGYGKTTTLMDLCLVPDENGNFRRSVFLTYSNRKAAELEGEFLDRIKTHGIAPRLLRVFGEAHIADEKRYRDDGDIEFCQNSYERKQMLEKGKWPIIICETKCNQKMACPYYRTVTKARSNVFDVIIGNLNEMQTPAFYLDAKFKFGNADLFILDEDAVRKAKFEFSLPAEQMVSFVEFLPEISDLFETDEHLDDFSKEEKGILVQRLEKLITHFREESGFYPSDERLNKEQLERRGFNPKKISVEASRRWFSKLGDKAKLSRTKKWYEQVRDALKMNCRVETQCDAKTGRAVIWFFPDIKDFKHILHQIGLAKNPNSKIIITDATSDLMEIIARFQVSSEDEIHLSYHPLKDGFIVPKGKLYQVVDNVSKTKAFDWPSGNIKVPEIRNLLNAARAVCDDLQFSKNETWIIPFQDFARNKIFQEIAGSLGFRVSEDFYHGAMRGLNELKDKDIIILGSNFPRDEEMKKQQRIDLSTEVPYSHCDDFLQWRLDAEGNHTLEVRSPRQLGIRGWMDFVEKDFGIIGRKIYLENVIQSMRSRFYWNDTKTLIFSAYPMTDYGIAVHGLMSKDDFKNHYLKKVS